MSRELIEEWPSDVGISFLKLNSYWGGSEKKRCVSLSINTQQNMTICRMTFNHAKKFFQKCLEEIEKIDQEYNQNPPWWEELASQEETKKRMPI